MLLRSLLLSLALYRRNRGSSTVTPSPCSCARDKKLCKDPINPLLRQANYYRVLSRGEITCSRTSI